MSENENAIVNEQPTDSGIQLGSGIKNVEQANIILSPGRKALYALGDVGNNFSWTFISSFLMFFWTDIMGVGAAIAGTIMMLSRVWDAINDPLIGRAADRTKSKWGRYRPWIIRFTVPLAIINILCFTNMPIEDATGKAIYACVTFFILVLVYTCVNVPYSAMTASLTLNARDRGTLSSVRLFFAYGTALFITVFTLPLVNGFGGGDTASGFFKVAIMYSCIMIVLHVICFKGTKEVVEYPHENISLKECFKALKGNKPVWILAFAFMVYGLFNYGRSATSLYYFSYVAGDPMLYSTYSLFNVGITMFGIFLTPFIARKFKNKATVPIIGYAMFGIGCISQFFVDPTTSAGLGILYGTTALMAVGGGFGVAMIYGMVPDTTEYTQHKYGLRAAGFISAIVNFFLKVGMAIGVSLTGWLMGALGYVANQAQNPAVLQGITFMFALLPGIMALVCVLMLRAYKLDNKTHENIINDLKQ